MSPNSSQPVLPGASLSASAFENIGHFSGEDKDDDEQFLLRAFRSFAEAAGSLEQSYARLRTEVERLRGELEKSNNELEETQAKLRREQALAEMSALLAHEIRNPLGSLELFTGLLAESDLNSDCREWVNHVQAGLRTLAATVNNVLHFHTLPESGPPEAGLGEADRPLVDLGGLLEWAHDFFLPLARQSRVTLSLQNRLSGCFVPGDRHRLEQVLLNLVLNAIRAMPGGGWIELGGRIRRSKNGDSFVITVADTGPGISHEHLPAIFEPGFSTRAGSPGLGLAVCRKIVQQHGGSITAASSAGQGATFTLTLPFILPSILPSTIPQPVTLQERVAE